MANPEHVEVVRKGEKAVRTWRTQYRTARLDLSGFELPSTDLSGINLSRAILTGATLRGTNLAGADLTAADLTRADLRVTDLQGAHLWGARLGRADLRGADLRRAYLMRADLRGADLSTANLNRAILSGADLPTANISKTCLRKADLSKADLTEANLSEADLTEADLSDANLQAANLAEANLRAANLHRTNLRGTSLSGANLSGVKLERTTLTEATCDRTVFGNVELSATSGLANVIHRGPSILGIETLRRSKGQIPDVFLRGCGLSDWEILMAKLYVPTIGRDDVDRILYEVSAVHSGSAIQMRPMFISYSHADAVFINQIERGLNSKGIRFWRDVHDLKAGRVERQLERAIAMNPTVLLVLSKDSVSSDWVEWEAAKARELEQQLGRDVLCPVALDNTWKTCRWPGPLRRQIEDYHILDFSFWQNPVAFNRQFEKLIGGLGLFYRER